MLTFNKRSLRDVTIKYGLGVLMIPHLVKSLSGQLFFKREESKFKIGFTLPLVQANMDQFEEVQ